MATFANIQIQNQNLLEPFSIVVVPTLGGKFDTTYGIFRQTFNYGNGIERYDPAGMNLTADQFVFNLTQAGRIDYNFKFLLTTPDAGVGIQSIQGNGMKLVGIFTSAEVEMSDMPIGKKSGNVKNL